jgi:hypothetical protein
MVPKIVGIEPNSVDSDREVTVNVSFRYSGTLGQTAYCRFGSVFVRADSVSQSLIRCKAPVRAPQVVNFAISFDSVTWSEEDVRFTYKTPWRARFIVNVSAYLGVAVFLIGFMGCVFCKKKRKLERATKDETAPFLGGKKKEGVSFARRKVPKTTEA